MRKRDAMFICLGEMRIKILLFAALLLLGGYPDGICSEETGQNNDNPLPFKINADWFTKTHRINTSRFYVFYTGKIRRSAGKVTLNGEILLIGRSKEHKQNEFGIACLETVISKNDIRLPFGSADNPFVFLTKEQLYELGLPQNYQQGFSENLEDRSEISPNLAANNEEKENSDSTGGHDSSSIVATESQADEAEDKGQGK
jgi:hypothetical protein